MADKPTLAARRQQQRDERRRQTAAVVTTDAPAKGTQLSFVARTLSRFFPQELVAEGAVRFDPQGQPRVGLFDPSLLSPNPQRGRVADRGLVELAASLDVDGQQEPILARLITDTDRQRWPDAFNERQILLILKGHRIFFAQPKSKLAMLRVELLVPEEDDNDLTYSRRALRRASIKMMHSQSYDIFDKVNLYDVWRSEFTLTQPKEQEVAAYFDISRSEARRIKTVANLDDAIAQDIINAEERPADEVVYLIANRPPEQQREAYQRFGHLTVAAARKIAAFEQMGKPDKPVAGAGRPRNFVLSVQDEESPIAYISTSLTAHEWKRRGGAREFWKAIQALGNDRAFQDRLTDELG
jgi:hypothetical protein